MKDTRVTRACETCGTPFLAKADQIARGFARFCSRPCFWEDRRRRLHSAKYAARTIQHPLANGRGQVAAHRAALFDKLGFGPHRCHWCGRSVTWRIGRHGGDALIPDHLDGNGQNNDPTNLVPSCMSCNTNRTRPNGILPLDALYLTAPNGKRRRAIIRACAGCSQDYIGRPDQGRFCSRQCAALHRHSA